MHTQHTHVVCIEDAWARIRISSVHSGCSGPVPVHGITSQVHAWPQQDAPNHEISPQKQKHKCRTMQGTAPTCADGDGSDSTPTRQLASARAENSARDSACRTERWGTGSHGVK
jgi:hypothetical protein